MTAQISLYELCFQDYLNDCNGYHEFVTNKTRSPPIKLHWVLRPWCIDLAIARSIHEGLGLKFPCNDRTDEVNKWYINWSEVLSLSLFCENNFDT